MWDCISFVENWIAVFHLFLFLINYNTDIKHILDLFSTENSSIIIYVDCNLITEQDFIYIQMLPYLLQSIQETGEYKIGCLNIQVNNLWVK